MRPSRAVLGEARRQRAHRAILRGECLAESRHVAAEGLLPLHEVHIDAARCQLLGGGHAGDAAADDQNRPV